VIKTRKRVALTESAELPKGKVDRATKVISGVKILGLHSRNRGGKRRYTKECLEAAVPLYEGAQVYAGHTRKAGQARKPDEPVAGWLENVRYERDGLYGDLHCMGSHPLCEQLLEAAERNPSLYCLSHNAHGAARPGTDVIEEILEVHSVDLVRKGGTTQGLFEGQTVTMKLSEYLAELSIPDGHRKIVESLLEDGYMDGETPMAEDAAPPAADAEQGDHEEALKGGFMASVAAIAGQSLDGSMDVAEACKKIAQLLKAHTKLAGTEGEGEEEEEGLEEDDESCETPEKKPMKESDRTLKARLAEYEAREEVRSLCEELKIQPGKAVVLAAAKLPAADRKALLEDWADRPGAAPTNKPRSQKAGGAGPVTTPPVKSTDDFVKALTGASR